MHQATIERYFLFLAMISFLINIVNGAFDIGTVSK